VIDLWARVLGFMMSRNQAAPQSPCAPSDDIVRQRCRWQLEETLELLEACFPHSMHVSSIANTRLALSALINTAPVDVDIVAYADANADIRYVAYGNDIAAGIDGRETDVEVALSNDTKGPADPATGKVLKGNGYRPPDIAGVLEDQGWRKT
jgi:predicted HAD superfamily Cof-like phosphohydrolase